MNRIKSRIPLVAFQTAIYSILSSSLSVPVYDHVPANAKPPYITFGAFTGKSNGSKREDVKDISLQLSIWSNHKGKAQVNQIADELVNIITSIPVDMSADDFACLGIADDMFESFPVDGGLYHGVVTIMAKIQNVKQGG